MTHALPSDYIVLRDSAQVQNMADYQVAVLAAYPTPLPFQDWIDQHQPAFANDYAVFGVRFKVIDKGWKPLLDRSMQQARMTIGGKLDVSVAPIAEGVDYAIVCRYELPAGEWVIDPDRFYTVPGVFNDLKRLFLLNNPMATPSNKISLINHYEADDGNSVGRHVIFTGGYSPDPFSVTIVGTEAWYAINISLRYLQAAA